MQNTPPELDEIGRRAKDDADKAEDLDKRARDKIDALEDKDKIAYVEGLRKEIAALQKEATAVNVVNEDAKSNTDRIAGDFAAKGYERDPEDASLAGIVNLEKDGRPIGKKTGEQKEKLDAIESQLAKLGKDLDDFEL